MESGLVFVLLLCGLWIGANAECSQTDDSCKNCPPGWTKFNGDCYLFVQKDLDWPSAEHYCNYFDGNLSTVLSKEEYTFIMDLIYKTSGNKQSAWLGATASTKKGQWIWSDGSPFDPKFSFWGPGQPNNRVESDYCMEIKPAGQGMTFNDFNKFLYIHYCNYFDGNLSTVLSKEEYTFIMDLIYKTSGNKQSAWLGATASTKKGQWIWSDGSPFDPKFSFWGPGQPNNRVESDYCMEIKPAGQGKASINNANCSQKTSFVCTKEP
ncbi:galactose-specific lectin nattectin [Nematolebias whitei]|uniref:galactose-specific lectin nattectin n=1 Tax=Nematolebias whitei TaxID=451745 RepID=UPI001896B462|nr:galactose-specific lectin nattectin [Nematolebias whitei]